MDTDDAAPRRFISDTPGEMARLLSTMLWAGTLRAAETGYVPPAVPRWKRVRRAVGDWWWSVRPRVHWGPCDVD